MSRSAERSVAEWVERLGDERRAVVAQAHRKLKALLEDESTREETAVALLHEIRREDAGARRQALLLLSGSWWPPSPEMSGDAVDSILAGLAFFEPEESHEIEDTALLLATLVHNAPEQLAALVEALDHPSFVVRWGALSTLARCELSSKSLPRLEALLDDEHPAVRSAAFEAVCVQASVAPAFSAPLLLAQAVAREGSERFSALAAVRVLLEQSPSLDAMTRLKKPSAVLTLLEDSSAPIRMEAINVLRLLGHADDETVQALRKLLRDPQPDVVSFAALALLRLVKGDAQALGVLGTMLCSPSKRDAGAAIVALDLAGARLLARAKPAIELALSQAPLPEVKADLRKILTRGAPKASAGSARSKRPKRGA